MSTVSWESSTSQVIVSDVNATSVMASEWIRILNTRWRLLRSFGLGPLNQSKRNSGAYHEQPLVILAAILLCDSAGLAKKHVVPNAHVRRDLAADLVQ